MQIKTLFKISSLFKISAISSALILGGCGGDINLSSNVNNSVGDTVITNPAPTTPTNSDVVLAGKTNTLLGGEVSAVMGFDVKVQTLDGQISTNTNLVASANGSPVFYAVKGPLEVMAGATLSIEPGVVVFGQQGGDYIVVHRDAKINAEGTVSKPIIFTSLQDVKGQATGAGQWGGLVLLGNAPVNKCPTDGSACALQVEGAKEGSVYGGTNWEDNSGVLKYVVVKYAGYEIAPDNELNGISFAGIGSGTTLDYIQVHSNADDGIEFWGGAANLKHLVLTGNQDDSIDWDLGYKGKIQFAYIEQDKNAGPANRGIEADNNGSHPNIEPQSNPTLSNLTIIGNNYHSAHADSEGIYLREGTAAKIFNTVVTGPSEMGECLEFEGGATTSVTVDNANNGKIVMQNDIMACNNSENFKNAKAGDGSILLDIQAWFTAEPSNSISTSILLDSTGKPDANSPLLGAGQDVANTQGAFFDSVDFIGAVNNTNDWRQGWAFGFGGGEVTAHAEVQGCPTGTTAITPVDGSTTTCEISGHINSDLTLTSNNIYALNGPVFVGDDKANSATLTIEAGTQIYGRSGGDYLVVSRDSKIEANGTKAAPITFTSNQDITGQATHSGQWGGLVLLGNASVNKCPTDGSACALQVEGAQEGAVYGGTDDTDSSGTLRYVVVKHAGYEIAPDNELNGISFAGIGSGTKVEYIQVHDNADDGIELWGGTVNMKYVVLTSDQDDSLDWDLGYRGNIQYILAKQSPDNGHANRGIEADNNGSHPSIQPQSNPTIANMTIIGNDFNTASTDSEGVYLREGTKAHLHNFVVTGTSGMGECLELEGGATSSVTVDQALAGDTAITNSVIACSEAFKDSKAGDGSILLDVKNWFLNAANGKNTDNSQATGMSDVINGIYTIDTTTPKDFTGDSFFTNSTHIGAVSADNDWTADWTVALK